AAKQLATWPSERRGAKAVWRLTSDAKGLALFILSRSLIRSGAPPPCPGCRSEAKVDPLRQGQLPGIVDGIGLSSHIGFPGIASAFPAPAGFFLAAECAADLRTGSADVHVGDTAIAACY